MCELYKRFPELSVCRDDVEKALELIITTYKGGGKLLLCGNGGSSADCGHIVGELMKGFCAQRMLKKERIAEFSSLFEDGEYIAKNLQGSLPAIDLTCQSAILSAYANDVNPDLVYAQLVYGYAKKGDTFIGLSTSGNSKNVVNAAKTAKVMGMKVIVLTGKQPCVCDRFADIVIHAPETETYKVQEYHLPIYHYLCAEVEKAFFN